MSLADQQERDIINTMREEIMSDSIRPASVTGLTTSPAFRISKIFARLLTECKEFPELKCVINSAYQDVMSVIDEIDSIPEKEGK